MTVSGGLLMYGIPNMKLEKTAIVDRRARSQLRSEGVDLRDCNANVGGDPEFDIARKLFEPTTTRSCSPDGRDQAARSGRFPGRDLEGIHFAMEFPSCKNTKSLLDSESRGQGTYIDAEGQERHRHRRRRHGHRLHRHVDSARLHADGELRAPAEAARRARVG